MYLSKFVKVNSTIKLIVLTSNSIVIFQICKKRLGPDGTSFIPVSIDKLRKLILRQLIFLNSIFFSKRKFNYIYSLVWLQLSVHMPWSSWKTGRQVGNCRVGSTSRGQWPFEDSLRRGVTNRVVSLEATTYKTGKHINDVLIYCHVSTLSSTLHLIRHMGLY